jgi:hypothetical protein
MCHLPRCRLVYGVDTQQVSLPTVIPSVEDEEETIPAGDVDITYSSDNSISYKEDLVCLF